MSTPCKQLAIAILTALTVLSSLALPATAAPWSPDSPQFRDLPSFPLPPSIIPDLVPRIPLPVAMGPVEVSVELLDHPSGSTSECEFPGVDLRSGDRIGALRDRVPGAVVTKMIVPSSSSSVFGRILCSNLNRSDEQADRADINPAAGELHRDLPIRIDLASGKVFRTSEYPYGDDVAEIGTLDEQINVEGQDSDFDRQSFKVTRKSLAGSPMSIRIDKVHLAGSDLDGDDELSASMNSWHGPDHSFVQPDSNRAQHFLQSRQYRSEGNDRFNPNWVQSNVVPESGIVSSIIYMNSNGDALDLTPYRANRELRLVTDMNTGIVSEARFPAGRRDQPTLVELGRVGRPITVVGRTDTAAWLTFTVLGKVTDPAPEVTPQTLTFQVVEVTKLAGEREADFKGDITMAAETGNIRRKTMGHIQDQNTIRPQNRGWNNHIRTVSNQRVNVTMNLLDDETFSDDVYDISQDEGKALKLTIEDRQIFHDNRRVGWASGQLITIAGDSGFPRARVTFRVVTNTVALDPIPVSTTVEIRKIESTGTHRELSGLDFKANISLAKPGWVWAREAPAYLEDDSTIHPGWKTSVLANPNPPANEPHLQATIKVFEVNPVWDSEVDITSAPGRSGRVLNFKISPDGQITSGTTVLGRVGQPFTVEGTEPLSAAVTVLVRQQ